MVRHDMPPFQKWVNVPLLAVVALLIAYGSVMVQSATSGMSGGDALFRRHLIGIAIGLVPLALAWLVDYQDFKGWLGPLVLLDVLLILSPRIQVSGMKRAARLRGWLSVECGSFSLLSRPSSLRSW